MNDANKAYLQRHIDILSLRELASGTIATYASYMTQFIDWVENHLSGKPLPDISWDELRSYVKYLKAVRSLDPQTINVHIAQLRHFWHYILHKDWDRYLVPTLRIKTHLPKVPTKDEVSAIIDSIDHPKHKAEIALLFSSGIRVSELCRLRCEDIHHTKNAIFISCSKNRSERFAVLSEKAYKLLGIYIRSSYPGATKEDWLFPGQKKGEHIHQQSVYNVFKHALASLNMTGSGYTLHSLRHCFGLCLYQAGTDIMSIKEALGHKSISSTSIYLTLGIGNGRSVISPYDL
jgi:site-specific recombinase XerD